MNLIKNSGSFKKLLLITPLLFIVILGVINTHYISKSSRLSRELDDQKTDYDKFSKANAELKNSYTKLQNDYVRLKNDLEAVNLERDNARAQARELLKDRDRVKELEQSLEGTKKDLEEVKKEKQDLIDRSVELQGQVNDLETTQKQLVAEKEQLAQTLEAERDKSGIKRIQDANASLKKITMI